MAAAVLILFAVVIVLFTIWFRKYHEHRRLVDRMVGPPAYPIIGNVLEFKRTSRGNFLIDEFFDCLHVLSTFVYF